MPRTARIIAPGLPHHVTQRGNRQGVVFFAAADRECYLELLRDYSQRHALEILGWCLMDNHLHLVVVPPDATALALALRTVHMRYAQWLNRRHEWTGHVWQNRFYSCVLDDAHCWSALRYVEQNPVRAGLTARAEDYPWSSAAAHCGLRADPLTSDRWLELARPAEWQEQLRQPLPDEAVTQVRRRTHSGLPCGDVAFVARMAALVGRHLPVRGPGRPKKQESDGH